MVNFPLPQVPAFSEDREKMRASPSSSLSEADASSFLTEIVEEVEFDYALSGRVQGFIPGLNEEESEDDRENPFLNTSKEEIPIALVLDENEPDKPFQAEDEEEIEPGTRIKFNKIQIRAQHLEGDASVLAQLVKHGLLAKLTQLVLLKAKVPYHLRDEAAQEVQATWSLLKAHPEFARNQMARYAYLSGEHAALKTMRALGAVVTLPCSLFSKTAKDVKGANAKFMQYIGAATNPHDIEDYSDSIEISDALVDSWEREIVSLGFFKEQMNQIEVKPKQYKIAEMFLVDRATVDDIAEKLKLTVKYVERSMHIVADSLNSREDRHAVKRDELSAKRQKALKRKGIVGKAHGPEAIAVAGRVQTDTEDMGLFDPTKESVRKARGYDSPDNYEDSTDFSGVVSRKREMPNDGIDEQVTSDRSIEIKRRKRSSEDESFPQENHRKVDGDTDSDWDIASMPDIYDVEHVKEVRLSGAELRRKSLGKADPMLEAVAHAAAATLAASAWALEDLLENTEKEHRRFSLKDIAVEVDSVMVDHFEFEV